MTNAQALATFKESYLKLDTARILNNLRGMFPDSVSSVDDRLLALLGAGSGGAGLRVTKNNAVGIP